MRYKIVKGLRARNIPTLIKAMNDSVEYDDIRRYQDQIIASILSSSLFVASLMNLLVRFYFKDPLGGVVLISGLFLIFAILIDQSAMKITKHNLRIHFISVGVVMSEITVFFAYYERIGTAIWSMIFLVLILSIIRLDRILFAFQCVVAIVLNNLLYITRLDEVRIHNELYYVTQIIIFCFIMIIGMLWSKIYQDRFRKSHIQYIETQKQKEEINSLYEEVLATEEELRKQNKQLHNYNEEIKSNEKKLSYMAYYDSLTKLPNRKHIIEKVNFLRELAQDTQTKFALVFVDLDGFKKINDTLGHHIGDMYLTEIGRRLESTVDHEDTVGRIGGDEFAIVIQHYIHDEEVYDYLDKIREELNKEILVEGRKIYSSASFGVAVFPDDAELIVDLFKRADAAMYKAKHNGKNNIQFFMKELNEEFLDRLQVEHELKEALQKEEFFIEYQPQTALRENFTHGFEALLRWNSPDRGVIPPDKFIYLLEDLGLIIEVGNWVLKQACLKILDLNEGFDEKFYISVNISPKQIERVSFVNEMIRIVKDNGVDPEQIELEITENVLIKDSEKVIVKLEELRNFGFKIALDDFGTGYASLNYLCLLPLDVLKIDKEFIWGIDQGSHGKKLVSSIIDIVHDLDITVVAEGVENKNQLNYLVEEQCDHVQGFLISKPMASDKLEDFIAAKERA